MSINSFNNSPYSDGIRQKHDSDFLEKNSKDQESIDKLSKEFEQRRKQVDERFHAMYDKYASDVLGLLSENLSVATSRVVQKELATQNSRVSLALSTEGKFAKTLKDSYGEVMLGNYDGPINNTDYLPEGIDLDDIQSA